MKQYSNDKSNVSTNMNHLQFCHTLRTSFCLKPLLLLHLSDHVNLIKLNELSISVLPEIKTTVINFVFYIYVTKHVYANCFSSTFFL